MKTKYEIANVVDLESPTDKDTVILCPHIVNDGNKLGAGVAYALAKRWPQVKEKYHLWAKEYGKALAEDKDTKYPFKLGQVEFVKVEDGVFVVNMIAQSDAGGYDGYPPIRYQSLTECLMRIKKAIQKSNKTVVVKSCLYGSKLAGGDWTTITRLTYNVFKDVDIDWTWCCLDGADYGDFQQLDCNYKGYNK